MSLPITFIFKSKKEVSLSEVFALFNWNSAGYISGICFSNSGLSMVKISSRYREVSLNISSKKQWMCHKTEFTNDIEIMKLLSLVHIVYAN